MHCQNKVKMKTKISDKEQHDKEIRGKDVNNNDVHNKELHNKESENAVITNAVITKIADITPESAGRKVRIYAKIISAKKTKGPVVLSISDGTGTITATVRRSTLEIEPSCAAKIEGIIDDRHGIVEVDIFSFSLMTGENASKLLEKIGKKSMPLCSTDYISFMVKSKALESLKPRFANAYSLIMAAILSHRPIIIRHHADCDGYCAGLILEYAILQKCAGTAMTRLVNRSAVKAPAYDYSDAIEDIEDLSSEKDRKESEDVRGLVIIADTGSSLQASAGIRKLKSEGIAVIVIDHHAMGDISLLHPEKTADCMINSCIDGNYHSITAGMLCAELAALINPSIISSVKSHAALAAAVSGVSDKSTGSEWQQYSDICRQNGYTGQIVNEISEAIDYESWCLRSRAKATTIKALLFSDVKSASEKASQASIAVAESMKLKQEALKCALQYASVNSLAKGNVCILELEKVLGAFGNYPSAGKLTGLVHQELNRKHDGLTTLGVSSEFIVLRSAHPSVDVNNIIQKLAALLPNSLISGGGHRMAGSIRFCPGAKDDVLSEIKELI